MGDYRPGEYRPPSDEEIFGIARSRTDLLLRENRDLSKDNEKLRNVLWQIASPKPPEMTDADWGHYLSALASKAMGEVG